MSKNPNSKPRSSDDDDARLVLFLPHYPHERVYSNIHTRKFLSPTNVGEVHFFKVKTYSSFSLHVFTSIFHSLLINQTQHPHVMVKAQSEVRQVFKGKKNYDEEDIEKLTYLKLVILRKY